MEVHEFKDFITFKSTCYKLFSDSSFLVNLPSKCENYKISMFKDKKDLSEYLQNHSNSGKMHVVLSGCIRGYSSKDDVVILFLDDLVDDFKEIHIGGYF